MNFSRLYVLSLVWLVCLLQSCQHWSSVDMEASLHEIKKELASMSKHNQEIVDNQMTIPDIVDDALKSTSIINSDEQKKYNIVVNNMPVDEFFSNISRQTGRNVLLDEEITGTISLSLRGVTLPQIIESISDVYGFNFIDKENAMLVKSSKIETRMFTLEGISLNRSGSSQLNVESSNSQGESASSSSSSVSTSFDVTTLWDNIQQTLEAIIRTDQDDLGIKNVNVNTHTGTIVVTALPKEMKQVEAYVKKIQTMYNKQVIIETRILEVQLKKEFDSGLDLNFSHFNLSDVGLKYITKNTATNNYTYQAFLNYISKQGRVSVLSTPKVVTVNKQKAIIKVGTDEFYLTGTTTVASSTDTTSSDLTLKPFFSGISLDVTPEIQENNDIVLHIHPFISYVSQESYNFTLGATASDNYSLRLPKSHVRESDSIIRAHDGQFVVIGGLIENRTETIRHHLPFQSQLGIGDNYGDRYSDLSTNVELVIVLIPRVVEPGMPYEIDSLGLVDQMIEDHA